MTDLPRSAVRFLAAANAAGLDVEILEMAESTRTAEEAAQACGCSVSQIVKSLVFRGVASGKPYLLLVSGKNMVDMKGFAAMIGEKIERPSADYVRDISGYSIGGIPPLGHAQAMTTYMDVDLLACETIFAAAGTPRCLFSVAPEALKVASGATPATLAASKNLA